jgi:hypothetical protein
MTGLVIVTALLVCQGAGRPDANTVGTTAASAPSGERMAERQSRLRLPLNWMDPQPQPSRLADKAPKGQTTSTRQSSTAQKVIGLALGTLSGLYAGGAIGFYLAQDKNTDDDGVSGLRGVAIGAPIGAAVGALIGYRIAR